MKKILLIFSLMNICFCTALLAWEFPIKPGTEDWKAVKNTRERMQQLQIPDDILHTMPTRQLLDICLEYPFTPVIVLNSEQQLKTLKIYETNFNGFHELFRRPNVLSALVEKYQKYDPTNIKSENLSQFQTGESKFYGVFLELAMVHVITANPELAVTPKLLESAVDHYSKWINISESFYFANNCALLTAHLCEKIYVAKFNLKFQSRDDYRRFLESGVTYNKNLLHEIMEHAQQM